MEKGLLYDKRVVGGFTQYIQIIDEVCKICGLPASAKELKLTTSSNQEYGYYLKNKKNKTDIFFGIWYEAWEHYESPFFITVDYYGKGFSYKLSQIQSWVEKQDFNDIEFKEFEEYALLVFQESFFNFENDAERIYKILNDLNAFLEVHHQS